MTQTIKKKPHTSAYKFRVAMTALKGDKTVPELCQEFGVVHSQIYKWKTDLLKRGSSIYDQRSSGVHSRCLSPFLDAQSCLEAFHMAGCGGCAFGDEF